MHGEWLTIAPSTTSTTDLATRCAAHAGGVNINTVMDADHTPANEMAPLPPLIKEEADDDDGPGWVLTLNYKESHVEPVADHQPSGESDASKAKKAARPRKGELHF